MELIKSTSILSFFETNKQERKSFVNDIIEQIKDGNAYPLKVHLQLKSMEEIIDLIKENKEYKSILLDEVQKNGKTFQYFNAEFQTKEAGTKYDFSNTNDIELLNMLAEMEALKNKIKDRQEFLKKLPPEGMEIIKDDEVIRLFPPSKVSTTTVSVKLL